MAVRRAGILLLLLSLLPAGVADARVVGAPSLKSLSLQLGDLPSGFKAGYAVTYNNTQVAESLKVGVDTLKKRGRISSYARDFVRLGGGYQTIVMDDLTAYHGASGARWEFGFDSALNVKRHAGIQIIPATSLRGVGNQSVGAMVGRLHQPGNSAYVLLLVRRGRYLVEVTMNDDTGKFAVADVVRMARIVDSRLRSSG